MTRKTMADGPSAGRAAPAAVEGCVEGSLEGSVAGGAPAARSAAEVLDWSRRLVDPALRETIAYLPESMRRITAYHFGWRDEHDRPAEGRGGKRIRPALVLLTAEAAGGVASAALPGAVAVELAHNFSLLHDDVMDGDLTRHHRATAWSVFGRNSAILAGDALLACAFEAIADGRHAAGPQAVRVLARAVLDLVEGQSADLAFERRADVSLAECLEMAEGKTAALLGGACAIGAAYGGAPPERLDHYRRFGARLGLAFQLVDDLLGIWGDPAVTGKPVHADLLSRKKSLPVVAALSSGGPAGGELAALYRREGGLTAAEAVRAAELVEAAGGRGWAARRAAECLQEALAHLELAGPRAPAAGELRALARLVIARDH
ncbi:family 2 encapsulin nanocompartment cargo protein polyprenyl transferase [Actinomadura viridis]|uniref:family 2 encapsulin nanocompartment cargo protein polyprenyl transferase n=1 Tax=Actinomadura viridis TaxID=58110 RepID=UPI0036B9C54E